MSEFYESYGYDDGNIGLITPKSNYSVSISKNNKIISISKDGSLSATVGLEFEKETHILTLTGEKNATLAEVDMPASIQNLVSSTYSSGDTAIILTFANTDGSETEFSLDVSDLVNIYEAGNGILISDDNVISLKLNETTTALTLDEDGLGIDLSDVNNEISALSAVIDSITIVTGSSNLEYHLQVDGKDVGVINIPKDQFLKGVTYSSETKSLIFEFVTISGDSEVEVSLEGLVDIYEASSGLTLTDNVFSVKIDGASESYLSLTEDGVKLEGIDEIASKVDDLSAQTLTNADDIEILNELVNDLVSGVSGHFASIEYVEERLTDSLDPINRFMTAQTVSNVMQQGEIDELSGSVITNANDIEEIKGLIDDFATKEWVENQGYITEDEASEIFATKEDIQALSGDVDTLSDEIDTLSGEMATITEGYATEEWVKDQGYLTIDDLTDNFATKQELAEVSGAIDSVQDEVKVLSGAVGNNSDKIAEIENALSGITDLNEKISGLTDDVKDVSGKCNANDAKIDALKGDLDALSGKVENITDGYATEAWVENKGYLTSGDVASVYALKSDVNEIAEDVARIDEDVDKLLDDVDEISRDYATQTWVKGQGYLTSGDASTFAEKQSVTDLEKLVNKIDQSGTTHENTQNYISNDKFISTLSGYTTIPRTESVEKLANNTNALFKGLTQGIQLTEEGVVKYVSGGGQPFDELYDNYHLMIKGMNEQDPSEFDGLYKSFDERITTLEGAKFNIPVEDVTYSGSSIVIDKKVSLDTFAQVIDVARMINDETKDFVTSGQVQTLVTEKTKSFVTSGNVENMISTAITDFITSGDVASMIMSATSDFVTNDDVNGMIESATTDFVNEDEVANMISTATTDFVTSGAVEGMISTATTDFVTSGAVEGMINTAITDFVTEDEVANMISSALTPIKDSITKIQNRMAKWNGQEIESGKDYFILNRAMKTFLIGKYGINPNNEEYPTLWTVTLTNDSIMLQDKSNGNYLCMSKGSSSLADSWSVQYGSNYTANTLVVEGEVSYLNHECEGKSYKFSLTSRSTRYLNLTDSYELSCAESTTNYNSWLFITEDDFRKKMGLE